MAPRYTRLFLRLASVGEPGVRVSPTPGTYFVRVLLMLGTLDYGLVAARRRRDFTPNSSIL